MMMSPAQMNEIAHPSDPDMPMSSPEVMKNPIPTLPEKAIPFKESATIFHEFNRKSRLTSDLRALQYSIEAELMEQQKVIIRHGHKGLFTAMNTAASALALNSRR